MANSGRMTSGSLPRLLQLGIDKQIDHFNRTYKGKGDMLFKSVPADKGFYEIVQLAGTGLASVKGEGAPVEMDSVDQDWVYRPTIVTVAKGARFTMESIKDNLYEDLIPLMGKEQAKSLNATRDTLQANILNGIFASTGPDGVYYASASHPLQAGGTTSNLVSSPVSLSEDSIEQMAILAANLKNPDGLVSDVETKDLVVPTALWFEATRIVNSKYRVSSADNDISAINNQSVVGNVIVWKRLSSSTAHFLTTNSDNGLMIARRQGVETKSSEEHNTFDVIISAYERYINFIGDFRGIICNAGV